MTVCDKKAQCFGFNRSNAVLFLNLFCNLIAPTPFPNVLSLLLQPMFLPGMRNFQWDLHVDWSSFCLWFCTFWGFSKTRRTHRTAIPANVLPIMFVVFKILDSAFYDFLMVNERGICFGFTCLRIHGKICLQKQAKTISEPLLHIFFHQFGHGGRKLLSSGISFSRWNASLPPLADSGHLIAGIHPSVRQQYHLQLLRHLHHSTVATEANWAFLPSQSFSKWPKRLCQWWLE